MARAIQAEQILATHLAKPLEPTPPAMPFPLERKRVDMLMIRPPASRPNAKRFSQKLNKKNLCVCLAFNNLKVGLMDRQSLTILTRRQSSGHCLSLKLQKWLPVGNDSATSEQILQARFFKT